MIDVYTVICREGEYDDISWREIGAFFEKGLADGLCQNAQACLDELRAQFPEGIKLKGLNPFDPSFESDDRARYYVQHTQVMEALPQDLAAADKVSVLERSPALQDGKTFFTAMDVEERLGERPGKVEQARGSYELYDEVLLMKIQYRNLTFVLQLREGLTWTHHDWEAHELVCKPWLRSSLNAEEWQRLRTTNRIDLTCAPQTSTKVHYEGTMYWTSPALDYFSMDLEVMPSDEKAMLEQFTRAFEAWLIQSAHRRANQPEFDADLSRAGL